MAELVASPTDPVDILSAQDATRIPELVPVRYERMLVSPFTFYRGAAALMAADLGGAPHSGLMVQLCGDAHLSNFGLFASPERRLVFDLNDFDETHPGPFEWDVKRLAASFELAARENGLDQRTRRALTTRVARFYRTSMARFATASATQVWYAHLEMSTQRLEQIAQGPGKRELAKARKLTEKAKRRDSRQAVRKLIRVHDGHAEWIADPPFLVPLADLAPHRDQESLLNGMAEVLEAYAETVTPEIRRLLRNYRLIGMARRVVGVGSVGTSAWVVLLAGADENDYLVLQAKEASRLGAGAVRARSRPPPRRSPSRGGAAADAGVRGHPAGLEERRRVGVGLSAGLLRAAVPRLEGLLRAGGPERRPAGHVRRRVCLDAGPGPRPFGGPVGHRGLSRRQGPL